MFDVVTLGDAISDIFIEPDEASITHSASQSAICFPYGDKIPVSDIHLDVGGSAANVAVGLARQEFSTSFIGVVGQDQKGEEILKNLERKKVHTSYVKKMKDIKSSTSLIISYNAERTILVFRGLTDYSKIPLPKKLRTKWLFVGPLGEGFEKLYHQIISLVSEDGINLALNPGGIQIEGSRSELKALLRITKILFLNKKEAEMVCTTKRVTPVKELLSDLKKMGPDVVVITDGSEGAYCFDGKEFLRIPAYQSEHLEVTGAGDAFSSGFLGALISGKEIKEALIWGIINSASAIEKIGAQEGLLSKTKIKTRVHKAPYPKPL